MKAILRSEVELWQFTAFAELAVLDRRPELQRLCAGVPASGALDEAIVEQQLPGLSPRGRTNLIRSLFESRLIDEQRRLTRFGHECAATGEAPAWELGVFSLAVARHPLTGPLLLEFKREPGDAKDNEYSDLHELPGWLKPVLGKVWPSALNDRDRFVVAGFPTRGGPPHGRARELAPVELTWEIELTTGDNSWQITGRLAASEASTSLRNVKGSADMGPLIGLHARWEPRWDRASGRALLAYDRGVGPDGSEDFLRSYRYELVDLDEYGLFSTVEVHDMPVGPADATTARTWATAITVGQVEAAGGYVAPARWADIWHEVVRGTPLRSLAGEPPPPEGVAAIDRQPVRQRTRWLLTAPVDLDMGG